MIRQEGEIKKHQKIELEQQIKDDVEMLNLQAEKQIQRENDYKNNFVRFDAQMEAKNSWYNQKYIAPRL